MKKLRFKLMAILLIVTMTALTSCSTLDSILLIGEDVFDGVIGAIDNSPLGYIYDLLDLEGWITGENGGNFENPDDNPDNGGSSALKVESIALDTTNVKLEFAFGEEFTAEGLKIVATMSDGSTRDIPLEDVNIRKPDTKSPGTRIVTVTYEGKSNRYEVTVNPKVYAPISQNSLVDIVSKNESVPYRVEAELIDMQISGVNKVDGVDSFVAEAKEGADITSGNKYLTGFGVNMNYFGFTFTAAEKYENVTIVLRVANSTSSDIDAGAVKMYLNLVQAEDGSVSGDIPLDGYIIEADGACKWADIVLRNITITEGTNTLTFEVMDDVAFDIDYVDFYVGMSYINSVVEIKDTTTVVKDIETLDTEKAFTRQDVADAHGLKDGQLFVEKVTKEWPGGLPTSGGTSVGAIGKGSLISTTLRLAEDATIRIWFKASKTTKENTIYFVDDNWNFYIDGVKLEFVQYVDIHGGDRSQAMYWEWKYTNLGEINLPAGDHSFVIEVVGTDCNVDTVEFEVVSFGSYDEIGKDLSEQKHMCDDACPVCGLCKTNCTEEACLEKCQGCKTGYDVVINEEKTYIFEAEDLDTTHLTPSAGWEDRGVQIETPTTTTPPTSGGKSLGAVGGGYTTLLIKLEEKATVQIYGRLALKAGGQASNLIEATIGETKLVASGTVPAGTSANQYFNWVDIPFGSPLELEAGEYTITIKFLSKPNVDCIKIDVLSYGEPAPHVHTEEVVPSVAPTCTSTGLTEGKKCSECKEILVAQQEVAPLGHDIVVDAAVEPTCTTDGKTEGSHCSRCDGATVAQNIIPATHKDVDENYVCDYCGENLCTSHNVVVDKAVEPTCTSTGLTEGSHCSNCNMVLVAQQKIDAKGHTYAADPVINGVKSYYAVGESVESANLTVELDCVNCDHYESISDYVISNTDLLKKGDSSVTISFEKDGATYSKSFVIFVADGCITDSGIADIEAEKLPVNLLTPDSTAGIKIESFTGGQGIGGIKGGYQIFTVISDKDVTVQLAVNFAKKAGGSILTYIPAVSVNGQYLTLSNGTVPAGVSSNQYWNLAEIALATIELKANVEYEFCVNLKSGNLDKYILKVVDGEGQDVPEQYTDVSVNSSGKIKYELENINPDKCDIITRADFISARQCAAGDVGRGNGTIYGFDNGTVFRVYVNVTEAGLYKISIAGKGNVAKGAKINLDNYSWKFGDTVLIPMADAKILDGSIGEAVVGVVEITEPGIYVFEFTFGVQTDLDYIAFEAHEHTEASVAPVAPTCTATGLTEGKVCPSCGFVFVAQQTVDALGHDIVVDKAVEPTCTADGKTEGSHCTRCDGATVAQESIPASHKDGNSDYVCDSCGAKLCTNHNAVTDSAVAATCTTSGMSEGSHCSICNEVLVAQEEIAALGHSYKFTLEGAKTDYLVGESFDTANLVAALDCTVCDHSETVSDYAVSVSGALKNSDEMITVSCIRNDVTYSESIEVMVVDARITDSGVTLEAENLPTNLLTPDSTAGIKIESFTVNGESGKSLGGIKGGYQIFTVVSDKDVTVQLNVKFAKKAGGSILTYIPAVSVNGQYLTLTNGTVPAGVSGNQYFNFATLCLATIELKANVEYEFCVNLKSGNLDNYSLVVVDGEGQTVPEQYTDITVATSGTTKYELESINPDQCDIITRADFVSARQCAAGDVGRGNGTIYGFDNGTVFRVYVNVTEACTLNINIAGKGNVAKGAKINLANYSWKFGDTVITPAEDAAIPDGSIGVANIGTVEITEAGVYVFEFTFGVQTDLDYISFEVVG